MSNFWGKTLLEAKKVGTAISKSAKEIGGAVGEATSTLADHTKKSAKIAMLKAEMDQMYTKLGKIVFNYGMVEENEEALAIMKELLDKKSEIEKLEKELDKCEHDHACGCSGPCDCECDCVDCDEDYHDDNTSADDCQCDCDEEDEDKEGCDCDCHKPTETPENEE